MKFYTLLLFFLIPLIGISQTRLSGSPGGENAEDASEEEDTIKPPISAYKIISVANDTTFVDTTLTIEKDYKFNYRRKDNFELLPFCNSAFKARAFQREREPLFQYFGFQNLELIQELKKNLNF